MFHLFPIFRHFEIADLKRPYSSQLVARKPIWYWLSVRNFLFLMNVRRIEQAYGLNELGWYEMAIFSYTKITVNHIPLEYEFA